VVGTAAERLESDGHRGDGLKEEQQPEEPQQTVSINVQMLEMNGNPQQATGAPASTIATIKATAAAPQLQATPDTVYGTYDAKTNSITIVMDGDAVPVNEAVEEIYCDGVTAGDDATDVIMKCPPPATSPSQVYLNVLNATDDSDDESSFDPIERFLRPRVKAISPPKGRRAKNPNKLCFSCGPKNISFICTKSCVMRNALTNFVYANKFII